MPWKVFEARDDSRIVISLYHCTRQQRDDLRIVSKGADADNGIIWIIIDIDNRSEIHIDAKCSQLLSSCACHFVGQFRRMSRSQSHITRKESDMISQTLHHTIFLINIDDKG